MLQRSMLVGEPDPGEARMEIPLRSRVDEVYDTLQELIVRGQLAPGSRLGEADLATRLGTSSTPVRGAINRLLQEGFIVATRNGLRSRLAVAPLTKKDGYELYYVLGELEGLAARWAAQSDAPVLEALVQRLTHYNEQLRALATLSEPDSSRGFELDIEFHRSYVSVAAGERLRSLHDSVRPQWERYERLYFSGLNGQIQYSVVEHDAIISGIAARNPDAAERAVLANYRNAAQRLVQMMDSVGESGTGAR